MIHNTLQQSSGSVVVADKGLPISTSRVAGVEPMPTKAKISWYFDANFSAKKCSLHAKI
jgi:hypothetical protein